QKRYADALVLAKQAKQLQPESEHATVMYLKVKLAEQDAFNQDMRERKADWFTKALNSAEDTAAGGYTETVSYDVKHWKQIPESRLKKYGRPGNRKLTEEEERIESSLQRPISLHFESATLSDVIRHLSTVAQVNIVLDPAGLEDVGQLPSSPVTINV